MIFLVLVVLAHAHILLPIVKKTNYEDFIEASALESKRMRAENKINLTTSDQHFVQVTIGTPSQSCDLGLTLVGKWSWVNSKACKNCQASLSSFDSSASSTYTSKNEILTMEYPNFPDEKIIGLKSQDNFTIGGFTVDSMVFILANETIGYDYLEVDGSLNLGFNSENSTFIQRLKNQGSIDKATFSLYFKKKSTEGESLLIIGEVKRENYSIGLLKEIKVKKEYSLWGFELTEASFDSVLNKTSVFAILSVNAEFVHGPKEIISEIFAYFQNHSNCIFDANNNFLCTCSDEDFKNYPELILKAQGNTFTLSAKNYVDKTNTRCSVLLDESDGDYWILGAPFLSAYFSIFHVDNYTIHFYEASLKTENNLFQWEIVLGIGILIILGIVGHVWRLCKLSENDPSFHHRID